MAVTTPLSPQEEIQFKKIAEDTIAGGGVLSQTAFMNKAREQGLETNPLSNRIWANTFAEYNKKATTPTPTVTPTVTPKTTPTPTPTTEPTNENTEPTKMDNASSAEEQALQDQITFQANQYNKLQTEFENYTKDIEEIDAENNPIIQDIKDTFARRISEMETTNKAMQGQVAIGGVRSGLARYASQIQSGIISNEVKSGMNRISELESQKLTAINQAKIALKSQAKDRWSTFNDFMDSVIEAYANKVQAVKDLHTFLKDEEDRTYALQEADIKIQQIIREEQEATAEGVAGAVFSALGDNASDNMDYINSVAKENNIDPNILISQVQAYEKDDMDTQLALQKDLLDLGAKLEEGETMEVYPGVIIKGTKKADEKWATSIIGNRKYNDVYTKKDGKWVRTDRFDGGQAYKPSTIDPNKLTDQDKTFQKDLSTAITNLSSEDKEWGQVYNEMATRYKNSDPQLFTELNDEEKKKVEEQMGGTIKFSNKDNTVMDVLLGKQYYYPKE